MSRSLFDTSQSFPLQSAVDWLTGTLLGSVATGLCVTAVALVGFLMLGGRLPIRDGLRVVIGCFVLLGAPAIATGFRTFADTSDRTRTENLYSPEPRPPRRELPPSDYDPYAGASLRGD